MIFVSGGEIFVGHLSQTGTKTQKEAAPKRFLELCSALNVSNNAQERTRKGVVRRVLRVTGGRVEDRHVLIGDDEPALVALLASALEAWGYEGRA